MNLVLINYVMEILRSLSWGHPGRSEPVAVLALNKISLWDFSSAFTDKYYQVHVLMPHPLMPTCSEGEWCWAGATSTCSVLSHWTFSQANLCHLCHDQYSTSASPVWHSYTQTAEYTWAEGGMWRIRKVFSCPWRLFLPEEVPHAARQRCVINTVNEAGFICNNDSDVLRLSLIKSLVWIMPENGVLTRTVIL